jgi:hypothetical protein
LIIIAISMATLCKVVWTTRHIKKEFAIVYGIIFLGLMGWVLRGAVVA